MKSINSMRRAMSGLKQKVVCRTPREPVNKQSALIVRPAVGYSKPLPNVVRNVAELEAEIESLKRVVEDGRAREKRLNDLVGNLRARVTSLEAALEEEKRENTGLQIEISQARSLLATVERAFGRAV